MTYLRVPLLALLGAAVVVVAGCGGASSGASTSWTDEFCRVAITWDDALQSATAEVAANPTKATIQQATKDLRGATDEFAASIESLEAPDFGTAAEIQRELEDLSTGMEPNMVAIEQTVDGAFYSDASAKSTLDISVAFMGHLFDAVLSRLMSADPEGGFATAYRTTESCQTLGREPG